MALAASAAGGGLFGLVGTVIGRTAGLVEARQAQVHEQARWVNESEMQKLRIEADAAGREQNCMLQKRAVPG